LILATTNDFLWKFERENVRILQQMGYVVHYATNIDEPRYVSYAREMEQMQVMVHPIAIARSPFMLRDNQKALGQLLGLVQKYPIRAIHCHTPVGGVLGRLTGKLCRQKNLIVIYTAHGFHFYREAPLWNHLVYYHVERMLAHYTDILIVINEEDYRNARRFHLKKGGNLYKLPGIGLDRSRFGPLSREEKRSLRQALGIEANVFFLLSIGELNGNKNHRVVLEALARIKKKRGNLSGLLYGICGDGFFRQRVEQWILELGISENVILYGHRTDIPRILGCADATAFPSRREGLGMAGLESLAMGIPVIASDNRGTREYMEHGKNGFICRWDDAGAFAQNIEKMWHLDSGDRKRMAEHCIASVRPFDRAYAGELMRRVYRDMEQKVEAETYGRKARDQYHYGRV